MCFRVQATAAGLALLQHFSKADLFLASKAELLQQLKDQRRLKQAANTAAVPAGAPPAAPTDIPLARVRTKSVWLKDMVGIGGLAVATAGSNALAAAAQGAARPNDTTRAVLQTAGRQMPSKMEQQLSNGRGGLDQRVGQGECWLRRDGRYIGGPLVGDDWDSSDDTSEDDDTEDDERVAGGLNVQQLPSREFLATMHAGYGTLIKQHQQQQAHNQQLQVQQMQQQQQKQQQLHGVQQQQQRAGEHQQQAPAEREQLQQGLVQEGGSAGKRKRCEGVPAAHSCPLTAQTMAVSMAMPPRGVLPITVVMRLPVAGAQARVGHSGPKGGFILRREAFGWVEPPAPSLPQSQLSGQLMNPCRSTASDGTDRGSQGSIAYQQGSVGGSQLEVDGGGCGMQKQGKPWYCLRYEKSSSGSSRAGVEGAEGLGSRRHKGLPAAPEASVGDVGGEGEWDGALGLGAGGAGGLVSKRSHVPRWEEGAALQAMRQQLARQQQQQQQRGQRVDNQPCLKGQQGGASALTAGSSPRQCARGGHKEQGRCRKRKQGNRRGLWQEVSRGGGVDGGGGGAIGAGGSCRLLRPAGVTGTTSSSTPASGAEAGAGGRKRRVEVLGHDEGNGSLGGLGLLWRSCDLKGCVTEPEAKKQQQQSGGVGKSLMSAVLRMMKKEREAKVVEAGNSERRGKDAGKSEGREVEAQESGEKMRDAGDVKEEGGSAGESEGKGGDGQITQGNGVASGAGTTRGSCCAGGGGGADGSSSSSSSKHAAVIAAGAAAAGVAVEAAVGAVAGAAKQPDSQSQHEQLQPPEGMLQPSALQQQQEQQQLGKQAQLDVQGGDGALLKEGQHKQLQQQPEMQKKDGTAPPEHQQSERKQPDGSGDNAAMLMRCAGTVTPSDTHTCRAENSSLVLGSGFEVGKAVPSGNGPMQQGNFVSNCSAVPLQPMITELPVMSVASCYGLPHRQISTAAPVAQLRPIGGLGKYGGCPNVTAASGMAVYAARDVYSSAYVGPWALPLPVGSTQVGGINGSMLGMCASSGKVLYGGEAAAAAATAIAVGACRPLVPLASGRVAAPPAAGAAAAANGGARNDAAAAALNAAAAGPGVAAGARNMNLLALPKLLAAQLPPSISTIGGARGLPLGGGTSAAASGSFVRWGCGISAGVKPSAPLGAVPAAVALFCGPASASVPFGRAAPAAAAAAAAATGPNEAVTDATAAGRATNSIPGGGGPLSAEQVVMLIRSLQQQQLQHQQRRQQQQEGAEGVGPRHAGSSKVEQQKKRKLNEQDGQQLGPTLQELHDINEMLGWGLGGGVPAGCDQMEHHKPQGARLPLQVPVFQQQQQQGQSHHQQQGKNHHQQQQGKNHHHQQQGKNHHQQQQGTNHHQQHQQQHFSQQPQQVVCNQPEVRVLMSQQERQQDQALDSK